MVGHRCRSGSGPGQQIRGPVANDFAGNLDGLRKGWIVSLATPKRGDGLPAKEFSRVYATHQTARLRNCHYSPPSKNIDATEVDTRSARHEPMGCVRFSFR